MKKALVVSGYPRAVKIYTLNDPISGHVRYVGKTVGSLRKRLKKHIDDSSRYSYYKCVWIKSVLNKNSYPTIELLDEVSELDWDFWEKYWIDQIKVWGFKLTNTREGGELKNCTPWNKNTKGICKPNSGSFKKGQITNVETQFKKGQNANIKTEFKTGHVPKNITPILQYSLTGIFLKEFESGTKAAQSVHGVQTEFAVYLKRQKPYKGYIWKKK